MGIIRLCSVPLAALAIAAVGLSGCTEINDPYYRPQDGYHGGYYDGHDSDYWRRRREHEEWERRERERERDRERWRRDRDRERDRDRDRWEDHRRDDERRRREEEARRAAEEQRRRDEERRRADEERRRQEEERRRNSNRRDPKADEHQNRTGYRNGVYYPSCVGRAGQPGCTGR